MVARTARDIGGPQRVPIRPLRVAAPDRRADQHPYEGRPRGTRGTAPRGTRTGTRARGPAAPRTARRGLALVVPVMRHRRRHRDDGPGRLPARARRAVPPLRAHAPRARIRTPHGGGGAGQRNHGPPARPRRRTLATTDAHRRQDMSERVHVRRRSSEHPELTRRSSDRGRLDGALGQPDDAAAAGRAGTTWSPAASTLSPRVGRAKSKASS